jgi:CBS domain-containing protein
MTKVSDLIRVKGHEVYSVQKGTAVAAAAQKFLDTGVSSLLVCDLENVSGIFTKNDLVRCCSRREPDLWNQPVEKFMSSDLFTAPPDADLAAVFDEMVQRDHGHVPVVKDGRAVGMITQVDILLHQKKIADFENKELVRYIQGHY